MNQHGPPVSYFAAVLQTKKDRLQQLEASQQQATNGWMQRNEMVVLQQVIRHFERVVRAKTAVASDSSDSSASASASASA